jgi:hypothetical protein
MQLTVSLKGLLLQLYFRVDLRDCSLALASGIRRTERMGLHVGSCTHEDLW